MSRGEVTNPLSFWLRKVQRGFTLLSVLSHSTFAKLPITGEADTNNQKTKMQNEEIKTETKPKFAEEGKGRSACILSDSAAPVYYGFNCTPRQVRYYKVEKSVEMILEGGFTRKDIEQFLEKVKQKLVKAESKFAEYEAKYNGIRESILKCEYFQIRETLRKEANRVETRMYNYEYETLGKYQKAVKALTDYLA